MDNNDSQDDGTLEGFLVENAFLLHDEQFITETRKKLEEAVNDGEQGAQSCLDMFNYEVAQAKQKREEVSADLFTPPPPDLKIVN